MKNLGIVEGFYGESLDFDDRNSIVQLLSENSLNYYLYAPKEDPFLRNHLDLEPTSEWQNSFKGFVDLSNKSKTYNYLEKLPKIKSSILKPSVLSDKSTSLIPKCILFV